MKIDIYCDGDPWDPNTWSLVPLELVNTLKKFNVLNNTYDINPERDEYKIKRLIRNMRFLTIRNRSIRIKVRHPEFLKKRIYRLQKEADKIYNSHSKPDAIIIVIADISFKNTPFYTFQDLDIDTIIQWRKSNKYMPVLERESMELLKLKHKIQLNVYEKASGIFVASDWIAENIKSYISDPKKVYSVGMGHRYFPIKLTDEILKKRFKNPTLLFIARNPIMKGFELMLKAYKIVQKTILDLKFIFISNFKDLPQKKLMELKKIKNIKLLNFIPLERLKDYYFSATIFALPTKFDAWGKVFLEAMSFGLPVIGSNYCAMPEFIINNHNGFVVDHDPEEIAEKIHTLLNSFKDYENYSKNALEISKKFTWDNVVKNMLKIINTNNS